MEIWLRRPAYAFGLRRGEEGGEYMNTLQNKLFTLIAVIAVAAGTSLSAAPQAQAASVTSHVRIVGTDRTIWYGDVTTEGCTITSDDGAEHVLTQPYGICALDAASKKGNFTYVAKDFGGSLGLFVQGIAEDSGAADFSTYWLYDVNGQAASVGIASYVVNNGDSLYFHFENPNADVTKRSINDGLAYLKTQQDATGLIAGFNGISSWSAMSFAAAGINPATVSNNGSSLLQYIGGHQPAAGASATEWVRELLAITAAGQNPFTFSGTDYVAKVETFHNNSQLGSTTQVNDDMFGLLGLLSAGDSASSDVKQDALDFILTHQQADGGFSWSTTGITGVDDTAAALQAFIAAQKDGMTAPNLATAIANAKAYILAAKNTDGGFPYLKGEASNASSTAWAVMALSALGVTGADIDSAKAYLRSAQEENGSFKWQTGSAGDTFTTAYAVHALTGKYWPVKVFAGTGPTPTPTSTPTPSPTATPTVTPTPTTGPTVTTAPTVSPTPIISGPGDNPGSSFKERMKHFREEQQRFWKAWRENFRKEIRKIFKSFTFFSR